MDSSLGMRRMISFDGACLSHVSTQAQYDFRSEATKVHVNNHKQDQLVHDHYMYIFNIKQYMEPVGTSWIDHYKDHVMQHEFIALK